MRPFHSTPVQGPVAKVSLSYSAVAMVLHWLIAALVVGLLGLGLLMKRGGLSLVDKIWVYQLHKSLGLIVLALMVVRLAWRLRHRPPPLPEAARQWERLAAHATHASLYLLLFALPMSGWLMVSAASIPVPTRLFGWIPIPSLPGLATLEPVLRKSYEAQFKDLHFMAAMVLACLIALHVGAALYHHFGRRDAILRRMLPTRVRAGRPLVLAFGLFSLAVFSTHDAAADDWRVDLASSSIRFEATAGGTAVNGQFKTFTPQIEFDPQQPGSTRVRVDIAVGSVATGNDEVDAALRDAIWLDAKGSPIATYQADKAERLADGRFQLQGALTLRGKTAPVPVPFTLSLRLSTGGGRAMVTGEIIVSRKAFDVGPAGPVAGLVIADEVKVRLMLEAEQGK